MANGIKTETDTTSEAQVLGKCTPPRPSITHEFFVELSRRKKLLRVFTQNIDGLEVAAGVPPSKVVQCHGTLRS